MSKKGTEVDTQSSSWTVKSPNPELAGYTVSYIKQQKNPKNYFANASFMQKYKCTTWVVSVLLPCIASQKPGQTSVFQNELEKSEN